MFILEMKMLLVIWYLEGVTHWKKETKLCCLLFLRWDQWTGFREFTNILILDG